MYDNKGYVVTVDIMHSDTHTQTSVCYLTNLPQRLGANTLLQVIMAISEAMVVYSPALLGHIRRGSLRFFTSV